SAREGAERMLGGRYPYGIRHDDLRARATPLWIAAFATAIPARYGEIANRLRFQARNGPLLLEALSHKDAKIRAGAALALRGRAMSPKAADTVRPLLRDNVLFV